MQMIIGKSMDGGLRGIRRIELLHWCDGDAGGIHKMALLHPERAVRPGGSPLFVSLHGAGATLFDNLKEAFVEDPELVCDIYQVPDYAFGLFVECREEEWWGGVRGWRGESPDEIPRIMPEEQTPVERRVMAQIEWVLTNRPIDRDRVVLEGASMGGSGTLGLGLCHGDVFSALKACVSAGAEHVAARMGFLSGRRPPTGLPDPPLLVEYSAQDDRWSGRKEVLYHGMEDNRFQIIGYWGPWGHWGRNATVMSKNDLVFSFDPTVYSRRDPYPCFTHASCDDPLPWPDGFAGADNPLASACGQRNAFFRWATLEDSSASFAMELRLLAKDELKTRFSIPESAVADVTMRRIQHLAVAVGERIFWEYGGRSGVAVADATGHVTLERLEIMTSPRILRLSRILS